MTGPRVLHLATSLGGGAGIAARRIVQSQVDYGIQSHLLAGNNPGFVLEKHESILRRGASAKFQSKLLTLLQTHFVQNSGFLVTPFSINALKQLQLMVKDIDVIHLHAFYNLLNFDSIAHLSDFAPLVITMHDQRVFTGGCHYSYDCIGYREMCVECPQVQKYINFIPKFQLAKSQKALKHVERLRFISPSNWLADLAKGSAMLQDKTISVIGNPVPSIYKPKKVTNPPHRNPLVIGFISENLNNPYKGLNVLVDALELVPETFDAELKFVGKGKVPHIKGNFKISSQYVNNPVEMVKVMQSCDVIVVPSLQDNYPSVISESLMCGTPVIGSEVGGISEVLKQFDMPSFKKGNSQQLCRELEYFEKERYVKMDIESVTKHFSSEVSALKHLNLYEEILN